MIWPFPAFLRRTSQTQTTPMSLDPLKTGGFIGWGSSRSSWSVSVVYRGQYDRRAAAQKRRGRGFPRQTRSPGQGAGKFPLASMVPSPAEERRRVEGSSALPEAELADSQGRPGDRISFHLNLHRKSSISLPLAVGGDWSPSVAQCAGSCYFWAQKSPRLPNGKTRTL